MLSQVFWMPFSQKGGKGQTLSVLNGFDIFCMPKTDFALKKNIRFWARFWSPKRPKSLFSLLGQLFGSGAFWAPKALQKRKMSSFSLFCSQKWKNRVFAILVEKGSPKRCVYKGFCASGESEWKSLFSIFNMISCFCVAPGMMFFLFFLLRTTTF